MKKIFWALILAIPMFVACGNDEPQEKPGPKVDPELNVTSETDFAIGYPAESVTVTFTANTDWRVASNDLWITATPAEGTGSEAPITVTLACAENEAIDKRFGKVYIFVGKLNATITINQEGNPMFGAAEELVSGSTVLATNPNVEKFLTEVTYEDRDGWKTTKVLDYYGGFNGKTYNENGEEDPNGVMFSWGNQPTSDQPCTYSIRWDPKEVVGGVGMTLALSDKLGWKTDIAIAPGSYYVNVSNLVPNDEYTYKVTVNEGGKVLTQGTFNTTGHLHQVFFKKACRNGRDLGGWKTLDGKTVKYRKLYRGGRMQSETLTLPGHDEVRAQGIGAQLDLRGTSDVLSAPAIDGFEFCAPVIEEGGTSMLKKDAAKTKQCFEFVVKNVREGRGVYFHCSLGRDRTGTLDILLLGLLGVREGDISKAYEVTYFAPSGYSVSSSEKDSNPKPIFKNTRTAWVYSDVVPYFWSLADQTEGKTFADGVEKYLLEVAGVSQKDIDDFRSLMLE